MKLSRLAPVAAFALLTACANPGGGVSQADFDALKAEVDGLKIAVYGDPKAKCAADKWLKLEDYGTDDAPEAMEDLAAWHTANGERNEVTTTASGLQYKVVKKGQDGPSPVGSQNVTVNYHGTFPDGTVFDSSYNRGAPIDFPANGVISGWVEALKGMTACEARTLYIPGNLAYGPNGRGQIPKNATLVFNVQLLEVHQ